MSWSVDFHDEFVPEFRNLPRQVQDEVYAVAHLLKPVRRRGRRGACTRRRATGQLPDRIALTGSAP